MLANIPFIVQLPQSSELSWDIVKLVINSQSKLAMYGVTVLIGVAVLIVATSWVTNFYLVRRELQDTIKNIESILTAKEEEFTKVAQDIKSKNEKKLQELEEKIQEIETDFNAEKARLFAIAAGQLEIWDGAAAWWASAIELYTKAGYEGENIIRVAVEQLNIALGKCKKLEEKEKKAIKKGISFIPKLLQEEKEQIEKKLRKLPKEETKKPETK